MLPLLALIAAIALPPKPAQYVSDRAGVLPNAAALNEKLANFERQTSDQILVYVDQHLPPDTTIEEMGSEALRQWGVGQKGKDNGAILFVFVADHKMRIEVGYGLEGSLTDAKAKHITSTVIKPAFQRGDYAGGIEQGVDAMMATVKGEAYQGTGAIGRGFEVRETGSLTCLLILLLWSCLVPVGSRVGRLITGDALGAKSIIFLLLAMTSIGLFVKLLLSVPESSDRGSVVAFGLVVPLAIGFFYSTRSWFAAQSSGPASDSPNSSSSTSSSDSSSSSSSSSESSSSSSSSFEGGGGSGGGGGASDSW